MDATPEPMIRLDGVSKKYDDGTVAVHDLDLDVPEGETVVLVGPVGLRQVDDAEDGQPADRADQRAHPARRRGRHARRPGEAAPADRLRHPADRAVPAPDDRAPTSRRCPKLLGWDRKKVDARVHELLELVGLDPTTLRQALPAPALRRPAAAGRRGPRARRRPAGAADGRAVRRGRPDRARPAAGRVPPAAARGAQDGAVRHPRHRRGGAAGRPDRGVLRGRPPRAVRRPDPAARAPPPPSSSPSFVGADRGLKRLSVTVIEQADLEHPPVVHLDRPGGRRHGVAAGGGRAVGRRARRRGQPARLDLGRTRPATGPSPTGPGGWRPGCRSGASLKVAFAEMLQHDAGWVAVLDGDRYVGVLTPATLHEALRRSVESDLTGRRPRGGRGGDGRHRLTPIARTPGQARAAGICSSVPDGGTRQARSSSSPATERPIEASSATRQSTDRSRRDAISSPGSSTSR